nr:PhoH family protein [Candidatus Eremiobacteraeota bacterium]
MRVEGDRIVVSGENGAVAAAERILDRMLQAAVAGALVTPDDVALAARDVGENSAWASIPKTLHTTQRGKEIRAKTAGQRDFVASIDAN